MYEALSPPLFLSLSQGLEGLTRLEELYLVNNKIAVVTDKVSALTNLTLLELGSNRLRQVLVYYFSQQQNSGCKGRALCTHEPHFS